MIFMVDEKKKRMLLSGGEAVAYAEMQINPEVCSAYPITPQTPIIETFAKYVSDGKVTTNMILTESEHSAMSACIGASAFGARTFTATSSQGLLYMNEVIYTASGLRLPIVMAVGNRAIGAPINIHTDHSDSFTVRDCGWVQIYCEDVQEVYDTMLMAQRIAEKVNLPVMVMQDGFYTTHSLQPIDILSTEVVKQFVGEKPKTDNISNTKMTIGSFALPDVYYEARIAISKAIDASKDVIENIQKEFFDLTKRNYNLFDSYNVEDADYVFVVLNSSAQLFKEACDEYRKKGIKIGVLRPRVFRPFPFEELEKELEGKKIIVVERVGNYGAEFSPLALEFSRFGKEFYNIVFGLGGRDFNLDDANKVVEMFTKEKQSKFQYYGYKKEMLEEIKE